MACQDGTIRTIQLDIGDCCDDNVLEVRHTQQVIVDGPIVCLCLAFSSSSTNDDASWRVTAGSLCGYVTEFCVPHNNNDNNGTNSGQGPQMVTQGLWDAALQSQDSVVTVHVRLAGRNKNNDDDDVVAVGTQSGRLLLYQQKKTHPPVLAWHCQLPYAVHGVCFWQSWMIVTTRRSLHVFKCTGTAYEWDATQLAERIKLQLQQKLSPSLSL